MIEVKFSLELTKNGVQKCIHAKSGEENSRKAVITLTENGKVFDAAGYYVKVYFDNGKHVDTEDDRKLVTVENGCISFVIPYDLVAEEGERLCEVQISKDNRILYSPVFKVLVEQSLGQHGVSEPVGDVTRYQEVIPDLMPKDDIFLGDEIAVYTPKDELTTKRKVSSLPFGKKLENEAQIERINASDVDELKRLSEGEYAAAIDANTKARHNHSNKSILDKFTLDDNGGLLFDNNPIEAEGVGETVDPRVTTAQTAALLLEDSGTYVSIETPDVASKKESDFARFMYNIFSGHHLIYAPPENGKLTYLDLITYENITIEVEKGGIYEFYKDMELFEVKRKSYHGSGILDFLKSKILEGYITEEQIDEKIRKAIQGGGTGGGGFSPLVDVGEITGGHRVTITDVVGTKSFDILNGVDGKDGENGKDGQDYVLTSADKTEIANAVLDALPTWNGGVY